MVAIWECVARWRNRAVETLAVARRMCGVVAKIRIALHSVPVCVQAVVRIGMGFQDADDRVRDLSVVGGYLRHKESRVSANVRRRFDRTRRNCYTSPIVVKIRL